jgi:hypothetical protein
MAVVLAHCVQTTTQHYSESKCKLVYYCVTVAIIIRCIPIDVDDVGESRPSQPGQMTFVFSLNAYTNE